MDASNDERDAAPESPISSKGSNRDRGSSGVQPTQRVEVIDGEPRAWGDRRQTVEDRLRRCQELTARFAQSLYTGGGSTPDPSTVRHRAEHLHRAVRDLMWHCQDLERDLAEYNAPASISGADGERSGEAGDLMRGHDDPCDVRQAWTDAQRTCIESRRITTEIDSVSRRLGPISLQVGQERASGGQLTSGTADSLRELRADLKLIADDARYLRHGLRDLELTSTLSNQVEQWWSTRLSGGRFSSANHDSVGL